MKYEVEIKETLIYKIEVEAENAKQAIDLAYADENFARSYSDENDSTVIRVTPLED